MALVAFIALMLIGSSVLPGSTQIAQAGSGKTEPIWLYVNNPPTPVHGGPIKLGVDWELAFPIEELRLCQTSAVGAQCHSMSWYGDRGPRASSGSEEFNLLLVRTDEPFPALALQYPFTYSLFFNPSKVTIAIRTNDKNWHFSRQFELDLGG